MNFVENIIQRLSETPDRQVLQEVRDGEIVATTCKELLARVQSARAFLREAGVKRGDRVALLANNSIQWAAIDLALMAEAVIVVPLYARQAPEELVGMMKDAGVSLICCGDKALAEAVAKNWADAPPAKLFDEILVDEILARGSDSTDASSIDASSIDASADPIALRDEDAATIIYTSGTSGEPKGVILNIGNVTYMLGCTNARLDLLMGKRQEPDQVFHYLPFCFAGSWILLLTCLSRNSLLTISTDLNKLVDEMKLAAPNYFLNVPALLERVRSGVEDQIIKKGGFARSLYQKGKAAWFREQNSEARGMDSAWLALADKIVFKAIKKKLGPNLKALICGSAPLAKDTQLFFGMIGIPVLQVYGLTETTAICTMDHPHQVRPGRVGPAIPGIEMKMGEGDEIIVRGPNIFPGYWNRPQETERVIRNGWFHTGDQGEVDSSGNWAIIGRIKNLIILSSGHNIAPEPIEEKVLKNLPDAAQVVVVGNGRSFLSAIVTGDVTSEQVESAIEAVNADLPHYKCIRAFHIDREPFAIENGLLTANGKLKRDLIASRLQTEIESLYRTKKA